MRCPKCGFISFDQLESCVKCGKNISAAATDLDGTVPAIATPAFLATAFVEASRETLEDAAVMDTEDALELEAEEEGAEYSLDEDSGEIAVDLGGDEEAEQAGMDFGLSGEEEIALEEEEPMGISDLAPEEEGEEVSMEGFGEEEAVGEAFELPEAVEEFAAEEAAADTFELPEEEEFEMAAIEKAPVAEEAPEAAEAAGHGLESLQVEGIDLEGAPEVDDSKVVEHEVKTGTALDDFDIDLGDLMSEE